MSSLIGFTLTYQQIAQPLQAKTAQQQALAYYPHLKQLNFTIGETNLSVWGYETLDECLHTLPDGSVLVLVGPEAGIVPWDTLQAQLRPDAPTSEFELPWEGRVILIRISADGRDWTMWNDWLGGIPVYYVNQAQGRIASILEPVVVAGAGLDPSNIFLPGLISIFSNGHTISDWTLYKDMKVILPDSVTEWNAQGYSVRQRFTIRPSEARLEAGWDDLVDEMQELLHQAVAQILKRRSTWILPLSSGLDSRILAGIGAEVGVTMHTYTWGSPHSEDAEYAPQIARTLGFPWKWLDIGTNYMAKYVQQWADLFGSATHFHGMYQMPFLDALRNEPTGKIASGFLGDSLSGFETNFQMKYHFPNVRVYQVSSDDFMHWTVRDLRSLFRMNLDSALEEVAAEIESQRTLLPGPWYQRIRFLTLWGRQRHFTYFQTRLGDHWRGAETPYLNRAYARFCLSIPRMALDERHLLNEVVKRYYGHLAVIPGSFAPEPIIPTGRYLLNRHIRHTLPSKLRKGPFRDFSLVPLSRDAECVRDTGAKAIWPVREMWRELGEWLDLDMVEQEYQKAVNGNTMSVRKLMSVQTLAYRLMENP